MNEDRLRRSYDRLLAVRADQASERTACPAPDAIEDLVERRGDEADRLACLDHVMACPWCREEFEVLRTVSRASGAMAAPARTARWWLAAAGLLLFVGPFLLWRALARQDDGAGGGAGAGLAPRSPAEDAVVAVPLRLVWTGVPDVQTYRVYIAASTGDVVVSATLAETVLVVPPSAGLVPGTRYRWWVEAVRASGAPERSVARHFTPALR